MKVLSSRSYDSILRDTIEAVKQFSWDTVVLELQKQLPTLMDLLSQIVKEPTNKKPFLCMVASQLLKSRHQHMGLVQRAVSIIMYGNGTSKQVTEMSNGSYWLLINYSIPGIHELAAAQCMHVLPAND